MFTNQLFHLKSITLTSNYLQEIFWFNNLLITLAPGLFEGYLWWLHLQHHVTHSGRLQSAECPERSI